MNLEYIFKIVEKDEWNKSKEKGIYSGSSMDIKDGYIHFSEKEQIDETLKNYAKICNIDYLKHKNVNSDEFLYVLKKYECDLFATRKG